MNGLRNKNGKRKELSKIEFPFKCVCGETLFLVVNELQKLELDGEIKLIPKTEKYICLNCNKKYN